MARSGEWRTIRPRHKHGQGHHEDDEGGEDGDDEGEDERSPLGVKRGLTECRYLCVQPGMRQGMSKQIAMAKTSTKITSNTIIISPLSTLPLLHQPRHPGGESKALVAKDHLLLA